MVFTPLLPGGGTDGRKMKSTRREFLVGSAAFCMYATLAPSFGWAASVRGKKSATLIWDPLHYLHDLVGHPESAARVNVTQSFLRKTGLWSGCHVRELSKVSEDILLLGHKPSYIQSVRDSKHAKAPDYFEHDKWSGYFGTNTFDVAARAATGLAYLCADVVAGRVPHGFALLRPPGHHATAARSEGFCIFNNVALAALHVLAESKNKRRIAIVDLDAHHGNGIQALTQAIPQILYLSLIHI